jgi:hypothetical protein
LIPGLFVGIGNYADEFEILAERIPELVFVIRRNIEALTLSYLVLNTVLIHGDAAVAFDLDDMLVVMLMKWGIAARGNCKMPHDYVI